jgi:uncharacterized membrane protein YeaQ/YmgE (transglycosylase-associated protein family)
MFRISNATRYASYSIGRVLRLKDDISFQLGAMLCALIGAVILIKVCGLIAGWIA